MPKWLERQLDNAEKTVAGWSKSKRIAAGIEQPDYDINALMSVLSNLSKREDQTSIGDILHAYLSEHCHQKCSETLLYDNQKITPLKFFFADVVRVAKIPSQYQYPVIVYIEWRGLPDNNEGDFWTVICEDQCVSKSGQESYEMLPSNRTDEWKREHRYSWDEAIKIASKYVESCAKEMKAMYESSQNQQL